MIRKMAIRQTVMDRIVKGKPIILPIQKTHMISTKIRIPIISKQKIQVSTIHQVKILKVMILTLDRNKMVMVMTRIMSMEQQVGTRKK